MGIFLFSYFIIINIISFSLFLIDKKKAIKKKWRISENTLLLTSLLGGSIGSLISLYKFHHKTKHFKFTFGIPFIIILQLLLFYIIFY